MRFVNRQRLQTAGVVAAVVGTIAVLGAVSRPSPTAAAPSVTGGASAVPSTIWYWTMAVGPSDPNVLVLATASGLYRSSDGGKTWAPTGPKNVNATSIVQAGNTFYAGGVRLKPGVPSGGVTRKAGYRAATDGASVLLSSTDNGATWKALHPRGLPNVSVQALAVDPVDSQTMYVLLNTGKLYRSTDGASSFAVVTAKLGIPPWAIAITQDGHLVGGDMDAGPHTSTDAKAWQPTKFKDARGGKMVMEYAVQPTDLTRILMSSVGVVMSTDGGKTWHPSLRSTVMFGPVAWAPSEAGVAYAIGFDGSLWKTTDAGAKWAKVS